MDCNPTVVLANAACLLCLSDETLDIIQIYLLCQIANPA